MSIIRPRLNDYHNVPLLQEEVDFVIPYIDEDIPLYLDPFLLWKSPSQQDNALHLIVVNSFNNLGRLVKTGKQDEALNILIRASECNEVGLGNSKTKHGKRIGEKLGKEVLELFTTVPAIRDTGFIHFEEIQLLVNNISKDRISDIASNFVQSFLVDYTIEQSEKHGIPIEKVELLNMYDTKKNSFVSENTYLPINPKTKEPIVYVPKRWLKSIPWINTRDYLSTFYIKEVLKDGEVVPEKVKLLQFNRDNYDLVQTYTAIKERNIKDCKNDPLFTQIPVFSAKRKIQTIINLPTGKTDNADRKFEDNTCQLLASLLYPHLDFAMEQSRTEAGVQIRDLIFYNNRSVDFLSEIYDTYDSKQLVFEMKNVKEVEQSHILQLNRYLKDQFGRFGIIIARNPPPKKVLKNVIDLWSAHRKCILILDDSDLKLMTSVFVSKQRDPIEVIKRKYIEFTRACPS